MALLVTILVCCVIGVTIVRGERAWVLIFSTIWFNSILVLLVVNIAFCFFGRIWDRKVTVVFFGMILFHLCFVALLAGIVYNNLFYFHGTIRLTEGETLPSGDPRSYDEISQGRFFNMLRLKGETTLIKMHWDYKVNGASRGHAFEIAVGEGRSKNQNIIYVTHGLEHRGFSYFNDKVGYSLLILLFDKQGRERYGAFFPLQSLLQKNKSYLYTTGTKEGPGIFPFPQYPEKPLFNLLVAYQPSELKERVGEAIFQVWPLDKAHAKIGDKPIAEEKSAVGEKFKAGDYYLSAKEVRYWVGMSVRYDPGKPIVLASLWIGLGGMIITFIGRLRRNGVSK
jgi:cytochrome c biogenesis protein ResB